VVTADADNAVKISEVISASTTTYNKVTTSDIEVENDISSLVMISVIILIHHVLLKILLK